MRTIDQQVIKIIRTASNDLTQENIAGLLGVSRITICRAIKRLKESGAIGIKQKRCSGKFAPGFYAVHRVSPHHNHMDIILNNYISRRIQRNRIQAFLKTKSSLRSDYNRVNIFIFKILNTIKTGIFHINNRLIYIIKLFQLVTKRPKGAFLLGYSIIPP
jgi:biotin operon repressor